MAATNADWQKFFGPFGDTVNSVVTSVAQSSSAVSNLTLAPSTRITRIVPSTSGLGTTCTFAQITQPWDGFQGEVVLVVASTSVTIATSSSGTGTSALNLGSTLVGYKPLVLSHDGTRWNPSYT